MIIRTDHRAHVELEQEVIEYLKECNFYVESATYHETMLPEVVQILQCRFSSTALYLRSRADRCAIHKNLPIEFEWEVKTHVSNQWKDLTLEALPLFINADRQKTFSVQCLYIFQVNAVKGAFWAWPLPKIRELRFPPRQEWQIHRQSLLRLARYYGIQKIIEKPVSGSGDPFVVIDKSVIATMPHWKKVIDQLLILKTSKCSSNNKFIIDKKVA